MRAIYQPTGAALEYAPLALNCYRGCEHGCKYCYVPACLRMTKDDFAKAEPRPGILEELKRQLENPKTIKRFMDLGPVMLSFSCDPYQRIDAKHLLTRRAIEMLLGAGLSVKILTKSHYAMRDFDMLVSAPGRTSFGVSLIFLDDAKRKNLEPGACAVKDRLYLLEVAHARGIRTWLSLEPVLSHQDALEVIKETAGFVDEYRIGKINHAQALDKNINWQAFLIQACEVLESKIWADYYIKDSLWKFAHSPSGQVIRPMSARGHTIPIYQRRWTEGGIVHAIAPAKDK
jgi:DNA repair photolyase